MPEGLTAIKITVNAKWIENKHYSVSADGKPEIDVATPSRFGGRDDLWSPLDLLLASLNSCLLSTFVAMAERMNARFSCYESKAIGELERVEGALRFTRMLIQPIITVNSDSDVEPVRRAIEAAGRYCPVARSLNAEVKVEPEIKVLGS
ncbi:MAG: OsmC family protein [Armatimonadota bacterium]|nr:OsmC family protein [Armatimonadota bacterium]MCX7777232.1 OsmC family protein [Armatimonadota bacterium]MDW8024647.1 OsmC family protein [Armatimonadota bacterium]